ncbi:hypothetical protein HFO94_24775 [Rhizobium leguminosarum]|uniref:hypothetical protein n=1 Tax=Rhizobium leguminosarum TaxID=384 RepID=UPI001C93BAFD|nr:hypothetical protein [Rhizobium leguminosarum]MBY5356706.1 hypothetical protein [Rhizobium leguminosarum]
MMWDKATDFSIVDLMTLVLTVVGGAFALWQYARTNRQLAARAAADEIEKFGSDEHVKLAFWLIDWEIGNVSYVDETGTRYKKYFTPLEFHIALRHHSLLRSQVRTYDASKDPYRIARQAEGKPFDDLFSPVEKYVRDAFDTFLGRLERVEGLIEHGVVGEKSFGDYFSYWLELIGDKTESHFTNEKRATLIEYINDYQFRGVIRLFARYGKDIETDRSSRRAEDKAVSDYPAQSVDAVS